jgi:hypothetical protein
VAVAIGVAVLLGGVGYAGASMVSGASHGTATPAAAPAAIPSVDSSLTGDITQCTGKINGVTGTLKSVDGTTVVVQTADGSTRNVTTSPSTYVVEVAAGGLSDVHTGNRVLVRGTSSSDGTIAAAHVQVLPAGLSHAPGKGPARPGSQVGLQLGLAIGTVAGQTANGFTVVGGDGSQVSISTSPTTTVINTIKTDVGALRVGHQVVAGGTDAADGSLNAAEVTEVDVPASTLTPRRPAELPTPPAGLHPPQGLDLPHRPCGLPG